MPEITLYTTRWCPFCVRAKSLLDQKKAAYTELDINSAPELRKEMMERSGRRTVPQIFINNHHVGGCDDLFALEYQGKLDPLLAEHD
ncbi:glutaredoxin 3 [Nitrincola alkalilacustris]|uniref:glutaredoxin 3 n=1 Tax=Nitrincola alkalilacustris TaxID=1571224 RepID=UPI00124EFFF1|nr:glutaredoxin 3 [Nitrincola alkalilacustris]